jgi:predicted HicB family RNase H-like nuclease
MHHPDRMRRRNQNKQTMAAVHVRIRPSIKAMAVRMAQEDKCSMAEWLEWLIEAEAARLGGKKVRGPVARRVG